MGSDLSNPEKDYEIRYKNKYLFILRKKLNNIFKCNKTDKYHKHHQTEKNNIIFS